MNKVFYDLEISDPTYGDIMSIGCVALDDKDREVGSFYRLIHVAHSVTPHVSRLTGLKDKDLVSAKKFPTVLKEIAGWIQEVLHIEMKECAFYAWGEDSRCLRKNVKKHGLKWEKFFSDEKMVNYQKSLSKSVMKGGEILTSSLSLQNMKELLSIENPAVTHNALDDARDIKEIYLRVKAGTPLNEEVLDRCYKEKEAHRKLISEAKEKARLHYFDAEIKQMPLTVPLTAKIVRHIKSGDKAMYQLWNFACNDYLEQTLEEETIILHLSLSAENPDKQWINVMLSSADGQKTLLKESINVSDKNRHFLRNLIRKCLT